MRRFQFGLRSLLVTSLLISLPTAWMASEMRETSHQFSVAQQLNQRGAFIEFDDRVFPRVTAVHLSQCENADDILELLANFHKLQELTLQSSGFDNDQLRHLVRLEHLRHIDLKWTPVSDRGLQHLSQLPDLRSLKLNKAYPPHPSPIVDRSQITDRGLAHLAASEKLDKLVIWGADVTDAGLEDLANCKNLTVLWLSDTNIQGQGLRHLARLTELERLDLCGNAIAANDLAPLQALTQLKSLSVARTEVTASEAAAYFASRPGSFSIGY